jgi:predicted AAA+ superfamily ATPase
MLCIRVLADREHAYLNFDDDQIARTSDSSLLVEALEIVYPKLKLVLFDEIQNFKGWELLVSKLQRAGYNVIVTGSNAHLLSGELATSLTGRHIPVELLPLSYSEIFRWHADKPAVEDGSLVTQYLVAGGFPEPLLTGTDTKMYLRTLFESVLYQDIVQRYRIRNPANISNMGYFLGQNIAGLISVEKLGNSLGIGSTATTQKLLGYLEQTFLFFLLNCYSHKAREQMRMPRKSYVVDPGFAWALCRTTAPLDGRVLENVVLIDLLQRGFAVNQNCFYYRTKNRHEVDFFLKPEESNSKLIQVSLSLVDPGTREREVRALVEASRELACKDLVIVTRSERETIFADNLNIHVYGIEEWLRRGNGA